MAKTLLQYSCLYILPFLFGMCLCGLEQEEFLTVVQAGTTKHIGRGRILLAKPVLEDLSAKNYQQRTQVILTSEDTETIILPKFGAIINHVFVYMKTNTRNMEKDKLMELWDEVKSEHKDWVTFQITKSSESGTLIECTISPLTDGTTYENVWFPTLESFGYKQENKIRILGTDTDMIQKIIKLIPKYLNELQMNSLGSDPERPTINFYAVVPKPTSIKVSSGGYVLDFKLKHIREAADPQRLGQ